jgi:hypothetical protein
MWPTPCTTDAKNVPYQKGKNGTRYPMLLGAVMPEKMWPTPASRDWRSEQCSAEFKEKHEAHTRGKTLPWVVTHSADTPTGGQLNPTWVEWLMGYPLGWTDSADWATRSSRKSRRSSVS